MSRCMAPLTLQRTLQHALFSRQDLEAGMESQLLQLQSEGEQAADADVMRQAMRAAAERLRQWMQVGAERVKG